MKKILSFALAMVMVFSLLPVNAAADTNDIGMRPLADGEAYTTMAASQNMIDMIKDMEGFSAEPYWDVSQWSIGYGSSCGTDPDNKPDLVWTEEQAEEELRKSLESNYGATVNNYCEDIGRQPTQQQFDALLDFTYNLGGSWVSGNYRITRWLENPTTEMELVNAMAVWGRVGSNLSYNTVMRRIREAIVFMKGEYYLALGGGQFETELSVVSNHDLPYYKAVFFQGNGATNEDGKSDEVIVYQANSEYGPFDTTFSYSGHTLTGWEITRISNSSVSDGQILSETDIAQYNLEVTAVWSEDEPEPTEPEPTEPEPTEPEPTDPEPTEPEPTDPEPTDPEPTEPEPTEPEPTDPEPTEPDEEVELPFSDVPKTAWYRDAVEFVYTNGYMNGTGSGKFSPSVITNRSMLVTVLYRIDGSPEVTDEQRSCFSDTQGKYYTDAVAWANANGIVNGTGNGKFSPEDYITRQDAITIFYRYCVEYLMLDGSSRADLESYADAGKVSGYAKDAMAWAVGTGLVKGIPTDDGMTLNPRGNLSRAEAATMLMRFVEQIVSSI